jgi:hypothetical protein
MTTKAARASERDEARERLAFLKPGDRVYCILRHRSASGMLRVIQLLALVDGDRRYLGYNAAVLMDDRYDRDREGIRVSGAGMDMGFHLVYNLGATLWPDGFPCAGECCPSNDHTNGDRDYTPDHVTHRDGGYALRHEWL